MRHASSSYLPDSRLRPPERGRAMPAPDGRREGEAPERGFHPLRWLQALISRSPGGITLVPVSSSLPPTAPAVESRGQALRNAHRSLHQLMSQRPALRSVMPHLAHVEKALGRKGSRALLRLPVPVVARALEQLESLQSNEPRDALHALRQRLQEALAARQSARGGSTGRGSAGVEVLEVSQSEFDQVERSWTSPAALNSRDWGDPSHL